MYANVDALRPLAARGAMFELASVIADVAAGNRALARRVVARLPALLINNDPRFGRSISFANFLFWERKNPQWAHNLEHAVGHPASFAAYVENWLSELADFQRCQRALSRSAES